MNNLTYHLKQLEGLPWWSNGYDSALPIQRVWVLSLVGESDLSCRAAWPIQKKKQLRKGAGKKKLENEQTKPTAEGRTLKIREELHKIEMK